MPFILASRPTSTPILQVQLRSSVQPGRSLPPVYAPHTPLFQTTAAGHAEDHITSLTKAESSKHPAPCQQLSWHLSFPPRSIMSFPPSAGHCWEHPRAQRRGHPINRHEVWTECTGRKISERSRAIITRFGAEPSLPRHTNLVPARHRVIATYIEHCSEGHSSAQAPSPRSCHAPEPGWHPGLTSLPPGMTLTLAAACL